MNDFRPVSMESDTQSSHRIFRPQSPRAAGEFIFAYKSLQELAPDLRRLGGAYEHRRVYNGPLNLTPTIMYGRSFQ